MYSIEKQYDVPDLALTVIAVVIAGVAAYLTNTQKEIERQRLMHELEDSFSKLNDRLGVCFHNPSDCSLCSRGECHHQPLLYALVRTSRWSYASPRDAHLLLGGKRWTLLSNEALSNGFRGPTYIDTQLLHEILYWFRRIARGIQSNILRPTDVMDLWRQVLPFITDGRFSYMTSYFGFRKTDVRTSSDHNDVKAIVIVVASVLEGCRLAKWQEPFEYLFTSGEESRLDATFNTALRDLGNSELYDYMRAWSVGRPI